MAQSKGKWGGSRSGAGRPRKQAELPVQPVQTDERDPVKFLLDVMQGLVVADSMQLRAAIAAAQYTNVKKADGGKKEEQADKAQKAASKFTQTAAPLKLVKP